MRWQASEEVLVTSETAGVVTATPISNEWVHFGHPQYVRVEVVVTAATNVGTQTLTLQQYVGGAWSTVKSTTFTAASVVILKLDPTAVNVAADAALFPVSGKMRVVLTQTNAGDKATVSSIKAYQLS